LQNAGESSSLRLAIKLIKVCQPLTNSTGFHVWRSSHGRCTIFGVILPVGDFETAVKSVAARDVGNGNPCETSLRHVCNFSSPW